MLNNIVPPAFFAQQGANVATLWQEAKAAFDRGDFAAARKALSQAVKVDPRDASLWFHLGVSCSQLGDNDAAIAAFERARVLAPKRPETYFDLGLLYWKSGNIGKAKEAYQAGLALSPNEPTALQNYALLLMKTGDSAHAIPSLVKLEKDPELQLSARVSLIECYLKTGQAEAADQEVDKVIHSNAGPADQSKVAAILMDNHALKPAERVLLHSLELDPDQDKANEELGLIYLREKRYAEAAPKLERATQLNPDSAAYAMAFAQSLVLWNHSAGLLAFLQSVQSKFSALPDYQYALALAYYGTAHYENALSTLQALLKTNPRRQDQIYYWLGNCYLQLSQMDEAEKAYRKAIEMNPKDPAHYEAFAILMRRRGPDKLDDAITQLKQAHQFDPNDPGLSLQLALCYESKGQLPDAAALIEEAVKEAPEMTASHIALARIDFRLGKKAEAEKETQLVKALQEKEQKQKEASTGPATPESLMDQAAPAN